MKDNSGLFFGLAAVLVSGYFFLQNNDLKEEIKHLEIKHQSFKEGVIYGR
ncbi:MAG: hypothetical protein AAF316_00595 [Cyanobacteria bacterium P01_A01_bin.80]